MPFVIRVLGQSRAGVEDPDPVDPTPWEHRPTYLVSYDPEAADGRGYITLGTFEEAHRFETFDEALFTYMANPACRRFRDDGKVNRPMMAFTVTIEPVREESEERSNVVPFRSRREVSHQPVHRPPV